MQIFRKTQMILTISLIFGTYVSKAQNHLMIDLNKGRGSSYPENFTWCKPYMYFTGIDTLDQHIFRSDGTYKGTIALTDKDGKHLKNVSAITKVVNKIYFTSGPNLGCKEIWTSNGEPGDARPITSFCDSGFGVDPNTMTCIDSLLLFSCRSSNDSRLYCLNHQTEALETVAASKQAMSMTAKHRINNGFIVEVTSNSSINQLAIANRSNRQISFVNLFSTSNNNNHINYHGRYLFASSDSLTGTELGISDGTVAGTRMIKDFIKGEQGLHPEWMTLFKNRVFFVGRDSLFRAEVWSTDGSDTGTRLEFYISKFTARSNIWGMKNIGDHLLMVAQDSSHGDELWVSDGSSNGTRLLKDLNPGTAGSQIRDLLYLDNRVYFLCDLPDSTFLMSCTHEGNLRVEMASSLFDLRRRYQNLSSSDKSLYFRGGDETKGIELIIWNPVSLSIHPPPRSNFKLFPNPTTASATIVCTDNIESVNIIDLYGRSLMNLTPDNNQEISFSLANYPAGVYHLAVRYSDGSSCVKALVVQ